MPAENDAGSTTTVDPRTIQLSIPKPFSDSANHGEAAVGWWQFGLHVIPTLPGTKRTAVKWDPWLSELSPEAIARHWSSHPNQEVGVIVGDGLFVLDADTPESLATIISLERRFGIRALLIHSTPKGGQHRIYKRGKDTHAKPDAHDAKTHPDRPDVRTGRSLIILPPAPGRSIIECKASSVDDLDEVGQDFIDAVARHNGRESPRPPERADLPAITFTPSSDLLRELEVLLKCLDPDMGYGDWLQVLMAVFRATGGDDEGLALVDAWSSRGSKYRGSKDLETKWRSFRLDEPNPVTIATLRHMVDAAGYDWIEICAALGLQFEVCAYEVIQRPVSVDHKPKQRNPLAAYSLRGRSEELAKEIRETRAVFGDMGLSGQSTAIFTPPNLGKTLVSLHELINAILAGRIDPENLYYVNVDDTYAGILTKLRIAEKYGFHMLAEGLLDFSASKFVALMVELIETDQARDVTVVLDTLKRFTNLMDKTKASMFTKIVRRFVMKGGTVIALAHTNKNLGRDGKPTYGGTSDIVDDFDCCYIGYPVSTLTSGEKVVEFENIKRRGNVVEKVAYRYNPTGTQSYEDLLGSVQKVDDTALVPLKQEAQKLSDEAIVVAVADCIREGVNTRKKICAAVMERTSESRRTVFAVMDRYTGPDLDQHHWKYGIGARGSYVYELLDDSAPVEPDDDDEIPVIDF